MRGERKRRLKPCKQTRRRKRAPTFENGSRDKGRLAPCRPSQPRSPRAMFTLHLRMHSCMHGTALRGETHLTSIRERRTVSIGRASMPGTRRYSIILASLKGLWLFGRENPLPTTLSSGSHHPPLLGHPTSKLGTWAIGVGRVDFGEEGF